MFSQDFKEFIESLNANKVRYLVVGGYAVAFHGHPRYTKDLDVWIENTPQNAARVIQALKQFGFGSLDLSEKDFLAPDSIVQLGLPPNRVELFTSLPGVEFKECFRKRAKTKIDGVATNFIDLLDFCDVIEKHRSVSRLAVLQARAIDLVQFNALTS